MRNISVISFTQKGAGLSQRLVRALEEEICEQYTKCSEEVSEITSLFRVEESLEEWSRKQFAKGAALVFIGACGIAVRAIAPCVRDKLCDSPVLVIDEDGQYVIPVLSGHVGGANELALIIAERLSAEPVITTATDRNRKFAVDVFARQNELHIVNKDGIVKVSARILAGKPVSLSVKPEHLIQQVNLPEGVILTDYPPKQKVEILISSENPGIEADLMLVPREYVLGMGCKKGKEEQEIEEFVTRHLRQAGINFEQVAGLASIDVKSREPGLNAFCALHQIPFYTYTAQELYAVEGVFHGSEFVAEQVGVDNVCERAALKLSGVHGRLLYGKQAEHGMTLAIAKREWRIRFEE